MSIFAGRATPQTRMRTWTLHAAIIEQKMNAHAEEARHDYFEHLYVLRDDDRRMVQLWAGNHPLHSSENSKTQVEGGAALVLSQDTHFGHVVALIYPYEQLPNSVKPIIWGIFDSPSDVTTGKWLTRIFADFATCCRASSVVDETAFTSDRLRMRWLTVRGKILTLRGRFRLTTKTIKARKSWTKRIVAGIIATITVLGFVTTLPSNLATLSGYSLPALWALWQAPSTEKTQATELGPQSLELRSKKEDSPEGVPGAPISTLTSPSSRSNTMPVITGWYTFCPSSDDQGSTKLLDFLYDVRANAGQVAFFDVQVGIDCVLSSEPDYGAPFYRIEDPGFVSYFMRIPLLDRENLAEAKQWISGNRDPAILHAMQSDNGSAIAIHNGDDSRNPLSRFQPHVEGSADVLFGPYLIKESNDDDAITFDLNASFLDSEGLHHATAIAKKLRTARTAGTTSSSPTVEQIR